MLGAAAYRRKDDNRRLRVEIAIRAIASEFRGHLKISHVADKRKNFHIGGEGVWTRFVVRSTVKKKEKKSKKRDRQSAALRGAHRVKSLKKCSLLDLQGGKCTHAEAVDRQISIALSKARLKALALAPVRHRVDQHWPSAF